MSSGQFFQNAEHRFSSSSSTGRGTSGDELDFAAAKYAENCPPFGKVRLPSSLTKLEITFLAASTISLLVTLGLSLYRLISPTEDLDSVFAIVVIINTVFCLWYIFHGVFWERQFETLAYTLAVFLMILYVVINFFTSQAFADIPKTENAIKLARMIVAVVLGIFCIILGIWLAKIYHISANLIVRTVGPISSMYNACKLLFFFVALIKFDLQLHWSMVVLVIETFVLGFKEQLVLGIGTVYAFGWSLFTYFAFTYEMKKLMVLFYALSAGEPMYVIYRLYSIWNLNCTADMHNATITYMLEDAKLDPLCPALDHHVSTYVTTVVGVAALIIRLVVLITSIQVIRNFGKGLKECFRNPDGHKLISFR